MPSQTGPVGGRRRAFTLVELLLVIVIIAVLISILVPALGGAREAARKAQTATLLRTLGNATMTFGNDHEGQAPGLFSVADMGHSENGGTSNSGGEGMSAMENLILGLSGSDAILGINDANYNGETSNTIVALVGPRSAPMSKYYVNPSLIGSGGAYFEIPKEFFVAQTRSESQISGPGPASTEDERANGMVEIPDLVDAWGQPILAWVKNEYGSSSIRQSASNIDLEREKFAQVDSDGAMDDNASPAWFYWNSNAAFLRSQALGKKREDMTQDPGMYEGATSALGSFLADNHPEKLYRTMAALLGSTAVPTLQDASGTAYMSKDVIPTAARAKVVLQSAGRDGIYLSSRDPGLANATDDRDFVDYGSDFYIPGTSNRITDDKGKPTSTDVIQEFDDIVQGAGS
ncbi:MAG: type II secretion system protein [Phycisphaerales bacterium]